MGDGRRIGCWAVALLLLLITRPHHIAVVVVVAVAGAAVCMWVLIIPTDGDDGWSVGWGRLMVICNKATF